MKQDSNARNANKNQASNTSGKGYAPPSNKMTPPAAGSHAPKSVHVIPGGHNAGGSVIHHSLKKGK